STMSHRGGGDSSSNTANEPQSNPPNPEKENEMTGENFLLLGASDTADQSVISLADSASNFDEHVGDEFDEVETVETVNGETADLQSGVVQGILHVLLLSMSAHITRELSMAPGGEFRAAHKAVMQTQLCRLVLGDRPIQVTLQRALGSLNFWQKIKFFWHVALSHSASITPEENYQSLRSWSDENAQIGGLVFGRPARKEIVLVVFAPSEALVNSAVQFMQSCMSA
ncbi:hypothetical protein TELCIR_19328, partial [Teladorsagia circumcincta]